MSPQYDEEQMGCGAWLLGYLAGSYFIAAIVVVCGQVHWTLAVAPVSLPIYFLMGVVLIGNSEVPMPIVTLLATATIWFAAIIACWGCVQMYRAKRFTPWPVVLLGVSGVATASLLLFGG